LQGKANTEKREAKQRNAKQSNGKRQYHARREKYVEMQGNAMGVAGLGKARWEQGKARRVAWQFKARGESRQGRVSQGKEMREVR
jgi:hypothetical protein